MDNQQAPKVTTPILVDEWTVKLIGYVDNPNDAKVFQNITIVGLLQAAGQIEAELAIRDRMDNHIRDRRFMLVVEAPNADQDTVEDS